MSSAAPGGAAVAFKHHTSHSSVYRGQLPRIPARSVQHLPHYAIPGTVTSSLTILARTARTARSAAHITAGAARSSLSSSNFKFSTANSAVSPCHQQAYPSQYFIQQAVKHTRSSCSGLSKRSVAMASKSSAAAPASLEDSGSGKVLLDSIPKQEIGALRLMEKHPEFDGRGAVVAIFDTGVDPAAAGLAVTSDGKPKVVDLQDCTGSGDVAMGEPMEPFKDDGVTLATPTGAQVQINPIWENPSGKWRVGSKPLYELYPHPLVKKMTAKRKEVWQQAQDAAVAEAVKAVAEVKEPSSDTAKDLKARVKLLEEHAEKYADAGPMVHCVTWHDGNAYRAALDTTELLGEDSGEGKLADFKPMTNFRAERQFGTFSALDACNYALNIYDEGATLSIVTDTGSHGTHVAGIVAACNRPDGGDGGDGGEVATSVMAPFEGVAPGAQIVSCKIGDNRVMGMETGPGLTRALTAVLENGVDVINMSYGEATTTPNAGRFIELSKEIVNDHGVIFLASAGNNGPGLTTVGAPGGTAGHLIGVGAYVSRDSSAGVHSHAGDALPEGWEGQQYNWSSRGPAYNGDLGVDICSMGGAIAPVPQWCQQRRQLMNGTSMSSPCAAGGVALIVSALKQLGQPCTPARVRRALENTAARVHACPEDTLTYGHGLIQVDAALEYLLKSEALDTPDRRIGVHVKASEGVLSGAGVYLRDAVSTSAPTAFAVNFTPELHRDADVRDAKLAVEEQLQLVCTADWLQAPSTLLLPHNGRAIDVKVDPTALPPGVHYAELQALEVGHAWRGPVARVPVTICKPLPLPDAEGASGLTIALPEMTFEPGKEHRHYMTPPPGATWAEMTLKAGAHATPKLFMIHATQLLPHVRPIQDAGLEVVMAQFWKSEGSSEISASVAFHGIAPASMNALPAPGASASVGLSSEASRTMSSADVGSALLGSDMVSHSMIYAPLRRTKINPKATLNNLIISLRPTDHVIKPLTDPRDALPRGRVMHRMLLTYKLSLAEGGSITPKVPPLDSKVYDGTLEGQLFGVFDSNKKRVAFGDVYPDSVTVGKGDYTIKLALRHESAATLTSLKNVVMAVHKKIDTALTVPCHSTQHAAMTKAKPMGTTSLRKGDRIPLFLGPVPEDSLPKDAKPGCTLTGSLKIANTSPLAGDKPAPCACPLVFTVPPPAKKDSEDSEKEELPEEKDPVKKMRNAQRDAQVKVLKDLKVSKDADRAAYKMLADELAAAHPKHLAIFVDILKRAASRLPDPLADSASDSAKTAAKDDSAKTGDEATDADAEKAEEGSVSVEKGLENKEDVKVIVQEAVAAADEVLSRVDQVAVAQYVAWKAPKESQLTAEEKKHRADMKAQKAALIDALNAKCRSAGALYKLANESSESKSSEELSAAAKEALSKYEAAFKELSKWVDVTSSDYVTTYSLFEVSAGRTANAIKALDKPLNDKDKLAPKAVWKEKSRLLRLLGWDHWAKRLDEQFVLAFPKDFTSL